MSKNYFYNQSGVDVLVLVDEVLTTKTVFPYVSKGLALKGTMPPRNALRDIEPTFNDKKYPILNEAKTGWTEIADHRQKKDERDLIIEGSGTAYYLPQDNYESEPRYMTELGELPEGALLIKPVITLVEAKAIKVAEITAERNRREQAGFEYMGKVFDADATSVQRLTLAAQSASLALQANQPFEITWTVQDDTILTMSAEQMLGVVPAIAIHADNLHQEGRRLKELVNKAKTVKAVQAINWD